MKPRQPRLSAHSKHIEWNFSRCCGPLQRSTISGALHGREEEHGLHLETWSNRRHSAGLQLWVAESGEWRVRFDPLCFACVLWRFATRTSFRADLRCVQRKKPCFLSGRLLKKQADTTNGPFRLRIRMLDLAFEYDKAENIGHTSRSQTFQMSALQSAFLKPISRFLLQTEQSLWRPLCQYFLEKKKKPRR